jgi:cobalt/nickel transport system ATP-binding protein
MILLTDKLKYTYNDGTLALKEVDFQVNRGEFLVLLGPNGSGKTTLFKVLTGLLKPEKGQVLYNQLNYNDITPEWLHSHIGFVFQDPNDQLFAPTVEEDVAFGPINQGLDLSVVKQRVTKALEDVGMASLAKKAVHHISYGQKKRVSIAGVLAMQPEVIILDEPTAGLDPAGVSEIMKLLVKLNRELGITIIMATHDVDLVPIFAHRISVLSQGEMLITGTPQEVFEERTIIRQAKLRLPRIAHLTEILKNRDNVPIDKLPLTIRGAREAFLPLVQGGKSSVEE